MTSTSLDAATLGAALREAGGGEVRRDDQPRPSWTSWSPPASPRAAEPPAAPSDEGGAYLNNERVSDPEHRPRARRRGRRGVAGAAPGQEELRGRPRRSDACPRPVRLRRIRRISPTVDEGAARRVLDPAGCPLLRAGRGRRGLRASEATAAWDRLRFVPRVLTRRHRRRPGHAPAGHAGGHPVRRRAHDPAAGSRPRGRGRHGTGRGRAPARCWWSRATPARPSRTIAATGWTGGCRCTSPPTAPRPSRRRRAGRRGRRARDRAHR